MTDTLRIRVVLVVCALILGSAAIKGTMALDFGRTTHAGSTYDTGAVYDPSAITGAPVDNKESVAWTDPGHNHGNGNGYAVYAYHQGPTAGTACSTTQSNYVFVAGTGNASPAYTDNGVFGGSNANFIASYTCYMIRTWDVPGVNPASWTSGTVPTWTSQIAPAPANQYVTPNGVPVGMFVQSISMTNNNGTLASGDTLVINYSQATNAPNLTGLKICTRAFTHQVYIGQSLAAGTCDNTGLASVGILAGGAFNNTGNWNTTWAWSNGNKTLTGTLTSLSGGTAATAMAGTWTLTPSQSPEAGQPLVQSADTTVKVCNANPTGQEGLPQPGVNQANICLPSTATHF
jgi:hypothetical protein